MQQADQMVSTRQFMRELNRFGITNASDAGGGGQNYPSNYAAIAQLAANREMTVRIGYSPWSPNARHMSWRTIGSG